MLVAAAPTAIGMVRAFNEPQPGASAAALESGVGLAFHPVFIACGAFGSFLLMIGLFRLLGRGHRWPDKRSLSE